jgi:hypothetical protein
MKKIILITSLVVASSVFAQAQNLGVREEHGNLEDEKTCSREVRSLGCGDPEDGDRFIECVDMKLADLSVGCRAFHKDEKRRKAHHHH